MFMLLVCSFMYRTEHHFNYIPTDTGINTAHVSTVSHFQSMQGSMTHVRTRHNLKVVLLGGRRLADMRWVTS